MTVTALALIVALLAAGIVVTYFAYDEQTDRVEELEQRDRKIESDHVSIGAAFAQQSKELEDAVKAARGAYSSGFSAGRKAERIPGAFSPLARYVGRDFLVPMRVARPLRGRKFAIQRQPHAYSIRWSGLAFFASSRDTVATWTRQAWPGTQQRVRVAGRRVIRYVGPNGVVHVWHQRGRTYAAVSFRGTERWARLFIATLR